jgi:xanthosine utilization system XapX-like protein
VIKLRLTRNPPRHLPRSNGSSKVPGGVCGYAGQVGGQLIRGVVAGAAGTTALNAVTYLDMALRARPASATPEATVRRFEELTHRPLSSEGLDSETAGNRRSGLGALLGIASGIGTGVVYGLLRSRVRRDAPWPLLAIAAGLGAMGTMIPMAALGVTDPRSWSASSWISDLVPHLAYGAVTAAVFEALTPPPRRRFGIIAGR